RSRTNVDNEFLWLQPSAEAHRFRQVAGDERRQGNPHWASEIVQEKTNNGNELKQRALASEERLRFAEAASGIATFDLDLETGNWNWSPQAALLFDLTDATLNDWEQ